MTNSLPRTGVEKVLGMFGCTTVLEIYPPPNSVPPQYSITGFPPASWPRYRISDGFEHSPVELNKRIADQSRFSMQRVCRQRQTMLGTTPKMLTAASCTNRPNVSPVGAPSNKAIVPRLMSVEKVNQGPIIHPKLVGQATTSPGWMS